VFYRLAALGLVTLHSDDEHAREIGSGRNNLRAVTLPADYAAEHVHLS
jgi:hypothetical protein